MTRLAHLLLAGACALALAAAMPAHAVDDADYAAVFVDQSAEAPASLPGLAADPVVTGALPPSGVAGALALPDLAADHAALRTALEHYERGRIADGDAAASALRHPAARDAARWVAKRGGHPAMSFARIAAFLDNDPDWAALPTLQRRAEEALLAQRIGARGVLAFFAKREPAGPAGRAALAFALHEAGRSDEAIQLIRRVWRDDHLGRELEAIALERFGPALRAMDHRNRAEMYLFRDNREAALRNARRVGADYLKLAEARLAVAARSGSAAAALAAVPASVRGDVSFAFATAQHHRRAERAVEAARALSGVPRDPDILVDGDEWWVERRLIARQLLDQGRADLAYEVARNHAAERGNMRIEAEWHAGWIALRFLDRPTEALAHFAEAARHAETPVSLARTAYWQARAMEALGWGDEARAFDEVAARQPVAFYGQAARARLGSLDLPLRPIPVAVRQAFHPAIDATEAMLAVGRADLARSLLTELARVLEAPDDLARLADLAGRIGDPRLKVSIGKSAIHRGLPLEHIAWPVGVIPDFPRWGEPVETALVYAITRQESAFDVRAVSHAGARGLMQLMLPTARETARRVRQPFEPARLTTDGAYNAALGAAHLADLSRDFRGSYVLMFAAYNAGGGNVARWIRQYGDPRDPEVDVIDWIERIPFSETRNYVQRVMENLQVYRARLGAERLAIAQDLARGQRSRAFTAHDPRTDRSMDWTSAGP